MAKYKLKNSNNYVNCEILNESAGDYIVRFNNGVIKNVSKNRVRDLDKIDEAVLDDVRDAVNKYGRKFIDKAKEVIKKVKEFFANVFVIRGTAYFYNEDSVFNVNHPANIIQCAKNNKSVNFYPSDAVIETCGDLGIRGGAVENFEFYGDKYDGGFDGRLLDGMNESQKCSKSLMNSLYEAEKNLSKINKASLSPEEGIMLSSKNLPEMNTEEIVEYILEDYDARLSGLVDDEQALLIFGAPGIGKSAICKSIKNMLSEEGKDISIITINGSTIGPEDFSFPAVVDDPDTQKKLEDFLEKKTEINQSVVNFMKLKTKKVCDLSKSWLPFYDSTIEDPQVKEWMRAVANGGKLDVVDGEVVIENEGDGGILFIDEFTRMSPDGVKSIFTLLSNRMIGSNITLGDKWIIVAAANRYKDMSSTLQSMAVAWEAALANRFYVVNYVPEPDEWFEWAKSKGSNGRLNIDVPEVLAYVEDQVKNNSKENNWGDYYNNWNYTNTLPDSDEEAGMEVSRKVPGASPRTWKNVNDLINKKIYGRGNLKGKPVSQWDYEDIVHWLEGCIGKPVAERFANFVARDSIFNVADAQKLFTDGVNEGNKSEYLVLQPAHAVERMPAFFNKTVVPRLLDVTNTIQSGAQAWHIYQFLNYFCIRANGLFDYATFADCDAMLNNKNKGVYHITNQWMQSYINDEDVSKLFSYKATMEALNDDGYFNAGGDFDKGITIDQFEDAYNQSQTKEADDIIEILLNNA